VESKRKQLLFAVIIGIVAVFLNMAYIQSRVDEVTPKQPISVIVAKQPIQAGTALTKSLVKTVRVPKDFVPKVALSEGDLDANLGNELMVDVQSGDYVLDSYFRVKKAVGTRLSDQVGENLRAISLPVDQNDSFAGSIVTGDKIDLLFTFAIPGSGQTMTTTLLQNVQVIATGSYSVTEQELGEKGGKAKRYNSLTLLLNSYDATRLNFARQTGKIDILLRNNADNAPIDVRPIGGVMDLLNEQEKAAIERVRSMTRLSTTEHDNLKAQFKDMLSANPRAMPQIPTQK